MIRTAQCGFVILFMLFLGVSAHGQGLGIFADGQEIEAPNIAGMSVQGSSVDLEFFEGDKNVLVVFYRMYS